METIVDKEGKKGTRHHCATEGRRCGGKWCGSFMITVGLLWLASLSGWINGDYFWPILFILMGTWMMLPLLLKHRNNGQGQGDVLR